MTEMKSHINWQFVVASDLPMKILHNHLTHMQIRPPSSPQSYANTTSIIIVQNFCNKLLHHWFPLTVVLPTTTCSLLITNGVMRNYHLPNWQKRCWHLQKKQQRPDWHWQKQWLWMSPAASQWSSVEIQWPVDSSSLLWCLQSQAEDRETI